MHHSENSKGMNEELKQKPNLKFSYIQDFQSVFNG